MAISSRYTGVIHSLEEQRKQMKPIEPFGAVILMQAMMYIEEDPGLQVRLS